MLAKLPRLKAQSVVLAEAVGRVLLEDITAGRPQPPFDASAMDGWAVRAASTPGRLQIVGESAAGRAFAGAAGPAEAVRIFTGAAIPSGADAVVIQEDASRQGSEVVVPPARPGQNVRPQGQDFRKGDLLIRLGRRLDPWRLALAASAGMARVAVSRRPIVAILATGEELVAPGGAPGPFQIFNSGTPCLAALVRAWGGEAIVLETASDDVESIAAAVRDVRCDLLMTLGGASVGDHDLVKPALEAHLGLALSIDGIAVRPGKPTWFGSLKDGRSVLGLPGNPASALVCAELFLRPVLMHLQGGDPALRLLVARSIVALAANERREHWMRARLVHGAAGTLEAETFADQDSSLVTVFAEADGLVRRSPGASAVVPGDLVEVLILERAQ